MIDVGVDPDYDVRRRLGQGGVEGSGLALVRDVDDLAEAAVNWRIDRSHDSGGLIGRAIVADHDVHPTVVAGCRPIDRQ